MDSLNEFFNVNIEYIKEEPGGRSYTSEGVHLVAFTKDEIKKYFTYIEQGKSDLQPIGNKKVNVVDPKIFKIFDFSKTQNKLANKRAEFEKLVKEKLISTKDYLTAFDEIGDDVTDSFNIKLEDILQKREQNIFSRMQNAGVITTETMTTTVDKANKEETNAYIGEISGTSEWKINVTGNLTGKFSAISPIEFSNGIIDNSIEPAFDVKKVAKVFANHIKNLKDESGQMIGVFGQWGRGKTYFIEQVLLQFNLNLKAKKKENKVPFKENKWNYLKTDFEYFIQRFSNLFSKEEKIKEDSPFILVKFQAWKYQNAPSVWAYLFETFIEEYLNVKKRKKYSRLIRLSVARNGHLKSWILPILLIVIGIFTFSFSSKFFKEVEGQNILKIVSVLGTLGVSLGSWSSIQKKIQKPATDIFNSISKAPSFKEVLGAQAEVQKELKSLVKAWSKIIGGKRILLFVDDLDRCSQLQMIDIIDSLRIMLDDELITDNVLILVALDEKKLGKTIKNKYEKLFEKEELAGVVDEYMDKLFISAIKLHTISIGERSEFVKKLICGINSEVFQDDIIEKQPTATPTHTPAATPTLETGNVTEQKTETMPISTPSTKPTPDETKSIKNLEAIEVRILEENIRVANQDLTPRQIRILIYRYLLARNLWIEFFGEERFEAEEAISEIMRFSGYNNEDPKTFPEINHELIKIARMVVAY